jgi:hypothetical protein
MSVQLDRGVRTNGLWRWVAVTVVLGVAALGYVLWIPMRHANPAKVAALAVTQPVQGFGPHPAAAERNASASPLRAVQQAAATTAAETAVDTAEWKGAGKKSAGSLIVLALPTGPAARAARAEARTSYLSQTSLTSEGYGYAGALGLAGVPGAHGATFVKGTSPTTSPTSRRTDVEVFSVGRVVVVATARASGTQAKAAVDALARAEYRHLLPTGGDPHLAQTTIPAVASLLYAVVAAAVLLAVQVAPSVRAAVRRRRAEAREAAIRRERASRGSKVVKRRAGRTPPGHPGSRRRPAAGGARARG